MCGAGAGMMQVDECLQSSTQRSVYSRCARRYIRPTLFFFFFQAEDGIRDLTVTGVQTCALPIFFALRGGGEIAGAGAQLVLQEEERVGELDRAVLDCRRAVDARLHRDVVGMEIGRASCRERV